MTQFCAKKAIEIAQVQHDVPENFRASSGFLTRWKKRKGVGIRRKSNENQKDPADYMPVYTK